MCYSEVFKALNKTRGLYLRWKELGDSAQSAQSLTEIEWTTTELRNSLRSIEWDLEDLEDTIAIVEKNPSRFKLDSRELSNRRQFIDCTRNEVKSMKEKMSILRIADRDITARQPLLEKNSPTNVNNCNSNNNSSSNNIIIKKSSVNSLNQANNSHSHSNSLSNTIMSTAMAARHSGTKYSKLENQTDSPSHYPAFDHNSNDFLNDTVSIQQQILHSQDEQIDSLSDTVGTLKTVSRQIGVEIDEQAV